jgi:hypothetical protein
MSNIKESKEKLQNIGGEMKEKEEEKRNNRSSSFANHSFEVYKGMREAYI